MTSEKTFWVNSGYGWNSRKPFVSIAMPGGELIQTSPDEARDLAGNILHCAEAAETDAFIFEWLQEKFSLGNEQCAMILNEFRKWRDK